MSPSKLLPGRLELSDGSCFDGFLFGDQTEAAGEVVFQTGMVGYLESLTDPSYNSQILVLTYPSIGNYGVPEMFEKDEHGLPKWFESNKIHARGLVVSELCMEYSHFAAKKSLNEWLHEQNVTCISNVDTRALVLKLRQHGTMTGRICTLLTFDKPIEWFDPSGSNLVMAVSCNVEKTYNHVGDVHIAVIDCGLKFNQIKCFCNRGAKITVLPWDSCIKDRISEFDALFISNGPGDPVHYAYISDQIRSWMLFNKPLFGICLGHQLIARALNLRTYKMKYGNRGHNQPCIHLDTGRCFITSQNHGYAVTVDDLPDGWHELFRNANDGSNEGLIHNVKPWMSVQFHPEHMAGPRDLEFLFDVFLEQVRNPGIHSLRARLTNAVAYVQQPFEEIMTLQRERIKKVLLLGSGGLSIGQAGEFDYSGSQALKALREEGIQALLINPNVATVQTTAGMADKVYLLPVTPEHVSRIIAAERPDGILIGFGGQTGLACGLSLENFMVPQVDGVADQGGMTVNGDTDSLPILEAYDCRILGTTVRTIQITEDRKMFAEMIYSIGEKVAPAAAAATPSEAVEIGNRIGYPVLVRAAFALGGMGSGFADNDEQLEQLATRAFSHTTQVFIDKSLKGWKEIEYEVLRDSYNNCITVCNMENIDPVGIHTGESIVVAPSQTLSNVEYNMLRSAAIKVACHLRIVGECNIQFALDPHSLAYYIIEVNARLSRSSALASKATGYPLAYIATKLSLGYSLPSLSNVVTGGRTTACFEPSLDYCVVKVPRWDLDKFSRVCRTISSSMKSVGEVMAISRCFEEALQKALRMTDQNVLGFDGSHVDFDANVLSEPTDQRVYVISGALHQGWTVEKLAKDTSIDRWFLHRMAAIEDCHRRMCALSDSTLTALVDALNESSPQSSDAATAFPVGLLSALQVIASAKRLGFSDLQVARALRSSALLATRLRQSLNLVPTVRLVDTVAGEWPATTNYLYTSYADIPLSGLHRLAQSDCEPRPGHLSRLLGSQVNHDVEFKPQTQILVLGSGVYRIGSSVEFDWCTVGCVRELRRHDWSTVMLNCNPETVSTDFDMCDRLYFDELSLERVMDIYRLESPVGVIVSMGGQAPNNIVMSMHHAGAVILGTRAESIDCAENRFKFSRLLDNLRILQPRWKELTDFESAKSFCMEVGYPCLVRPSYVLSGAAMNVAYDYEDLVTYLSAAISISPEHPVVISQFILDAKEIDVDAVAQSGRVVAMAVSEHVENAGVHSGDATLVTPPQDLNKETLGLIKELVVVLADELQVSGPFNLQLIAKDNRLQIIEVNLRVSRSFPFVSKTLRYDFVAAATRCILGATRESIYPPHRRPVDLRCSLSQEFVEPAVDVLAGVPHQVGVKVPVFSFSRLFGADVLLGVEMVSTGEVACLGQDRYEAFLLAQEASLVNTNGRLPRPGESIFLSVGTFLHKLELMNSVSQLHQLGYKLFGSCNTADYYQTQGIPFTSVIWPYEENDLSKSVMSGSAVASSEGSSRERTIHECLTEKQFALIISLTMRKTGYRKQSAFATRGYMMRRLAVDTNVPLITDVKVVKLLAEALNRRYNPALKSVVSDRSSRCLGPMRCITSNQIILLPGLIDVHVHTRDPGQEYKEDWDSVTQAALAGGIVAIFAMPNTNPPVVDQASLEVASKRAASRARCDYALFAGATVDNAGVVGRLSRSVIGLKMYLNETFTTLSMVGRMDVWRKHFQLWPANIPICCHAEGETTAAVILLSQLTDRPVHICHVARRCEIELIRDAKVRGLNVTCEVAPHHLFLSSEDDSVPACKGFREVRPRLGTKDDVSALWANMSVIDCFATDHAPHLASEKASDRAPPGFPGLESMLPLLLTAMSEGRLTLADLVERLCTNPRRIFGLPPLSRWDACGDITAEGCGDTWVEVDMSAEWCLPGAVAGDSGSYSREPNDGVLHTRAGWSPFAGRPVRGRVRRVMLRGTLAFVDDRVLVKPGFGVNLVNQRSAPLVIVAPPPELLLPPTQEAVDRQTVYNRSNSPMHRVHLDSYNEYLPPQVPGTQPEDTSTSITLMTSEGARGAPPVPLAPASAINLLWTDGLSGHHILSSTAFTKAHLHRLFNVAHSFRLALLKQKQLDHICRGKVMASLFFEPSTRTCNSFAVAMQRLGGTVVHFTEQTSSLNKGESLADTLRVLASYTDCLVIRHPGRGTVQEAALSVTNRPIINAGDGVGEHPTQALLDVFTIREEIGTVNGLTITMVGDLANGRTVHSLARLLCLYNVRLRYVTHCRSLCMPDEVKAYVAERGIPQEEMSSLAEALPDTDVLYMTRVQAERLPNDHDSASSRDQQFVVTPELMTLAKPTGMIVMHPLPRVGEIHPSFDSDPRAAYFRQAEHGVYVRMALLALVMAKPK